jgi:hypothetical protein
MDPSARKTRQGATGILMASGVAKKRGGGDDRKSGEADREANPAYDQFARGVNVPRQTGDFDDPITF